MFIDIFRLLYFMALSPQKTRDRFSFKMNGWSYRGIETVLETVDEFTEGEMTSSSASDKSQESLFNEEKKLVKPVTETPIPFEERNQNNRFEQAFRSPPQPCLTYDLKNFNQSRPPVPFNRRRSSSDPTEFFRLKRWSSLSSIADDGEAEESMIGEDLIDGSDYYNFAPANFRERLLLCLQNAFYGLFSSVKEANEKFGNSVTPSSSIPEEKYEEKFVLPVLKHLRIFECPQLCYQNNLLSPEDSKQLYRYKCALMTGDLHFQNCLKMNGDGETTRGAPMEHVLMYIPRKYSLGNHPSVCRTSRTTSQFGFPHNGGTSRRASVGTSAASHYSRPRVGRRGSEVPAMTSIARLRRISNSPSYPVGLKRRGSRGFSNTDFQISTIQAKAKNEMLANLVLPVISDTPPLLRERRITCHYYSPSVVKNKKEEKRLRVAKEILDTEKKYLASLITLQKVFEEPLRSSSLISAKEMDIVFPKELENIRLSHTLFMKDLEERIQNWKQHGIVGDIFTKLSSSYHIDVLRIYSTYLNNFPKAIAVINKCCRNSHKFRKFLQSCSEHHECEGLNLPAFLLTPIQRLPRYVLLLRQMNKNTDTTHPDSFHVNKALETMTHMINVLNDSIQNSCKLAYTSTLHKNLKRRKLRKRSTLRARHQNMKDLQTAQDLSSQLSVNSNQSTLSAGSGASEEVARQDSLSVDEQGRKKTYLQTGGTDRLHEESPPPSPCNSVQLRSRNKERKPRPLSSGGESSDFLSENESHNEFSTIAEESPDECKENVDKPTSKFRAAAENVINNWRKKSRRWRKSFDGDSEKSVEDDLDNQLSKNKRENNATEESNETCVFDQSTSTDTDTFLPNFSLSSKTSEDNLQKDLTKNKQEYSTNGENATCNSSEDILSKEFQVDSKRPTSKSLESNYSSNLNPTLLVVNEVLSDDNITEKNFNLPSTVWIRRRDNSIVSRTRSWRDLLEPEAANLQRSSFASSDAGSPLSTSRGSLEDTSQDSLIDSGVSTEESPTNTLSSTKEKKISKSLCHVNSTGESSTKLARFNRRSWDEWVNTEMGQTPATQAELSECSSGELKVAAKSQNRFKNVVKQLFSARKRQNASQTSKGGPESAVLTLKKQELLTREEKISTV